MNVYHANVFQTVPPPNQSAFREAVAQIINNVQGKLTDNALGDALGCSGATIGNARRCVSNLDGVTLMRIAYVFGPAALNPLMKLAGGRSVPLNPNEGCVDTLAATCGEFLTFHVGARHPESPAGVEYCHVEKAQAKRLAPRIAALAAQVA